MKRVLLGLLVLAPLGCNKSSEPAKAPVVSDPAFDTQWAALEKGAEPMFIEGETHGAGLMGEVRRAVDPIAEGASPIAKDPIKGQLPDNDVLKVIRANLGAVKACYQIEERSGSVGSGKAIVSLQIDSSGSVANVKVDAPAFQESHLPQCVGSRAKGWTFPKFTEGPKSFSYPFVFVGG
jgi:hypothetical protein